MCGRLLLLAEAECESNQRRARVTPFDCSSQERGSARPRQEVESIGSVVKLIELERTAIVMEPSRSTTCARYCPSISMFEHTKAILDGLLERRASSITRAKFGRSRTERDGHRIIELKPARCCTVIEQSPVQTRH